MKITQKIKRIICTTIVGITMIIMMQEHSIGQINAITTAQAAEPKEFDGKYIMLPEGLGSNIVLSKNAIYKEDDLEYYVQYKNFKLYDNANGGCRDFDVNYPQIVFKDGRKADEINQILRDGACVQLDKMYPKVDKEQVAGYDEDNPYLRTHVYYEMTYLSNDLLCVAYTDHYFSGSFYIEYNDIRTRIINLKTAEVYGIADILTYDDELAKTYYKEIVAQEEGFQKAKEFTQDTAAETLVGKVPDNRYFSNIILFKDGMDINLTFHYGDGSYIFRGWLSVPFTEEALQDYHTDGEFWDYYKK